MKEYTDEDLKTDIEWLEGYDMETTEAENFILGLLEKVYEQDVKKEDNYIKKGEVTGEIFKVLMHDLQCLELKDTKDNKYHYNLLMGNLTGLFGNLDYCESCEEYIDQIDLGDGSFGCPLCKSPNQITTFYNSDDEEDEQ